MTGRTMTTTARLERWQRRANGTLMARAPRTKIATKTFCLVEVELRGLEPLTPCLQRRWPHPQDLRSHRPGVLPVAP